MQRTQRRLRRINIFTPSSQDSGYVGKRTVPTPVGYVYAEVFPEKSVLSDERDGKRTSAGATLVLRRDAGVKCGDLAGIYGDDPDSRVIEALVSPGYMKVRTERI